MQTHHASTSHPANAASLATHSTPALQAAQPQSDYSAWTTQRKRTVAELVDDQDALAEWHRNVAHLRADVKG
jgi:hypothetical protein